MPGARLTARDRQDIAAGLADGLTYAEIAKRLDRPTSTVTREIARNGGPSGYRPLQAELATRRRARRSAPSRAATAPRTEPARDSDAVRAVEEQLTAALVDEGLPRLTARVLVCLFTTDSGSLTAADLVERLRVSPASISTAIRYLEGQQLVTRRRDGGSRRDRYHMDDDTWYRAMLATATRNALMARTVREGAEALGSATSAGRRLQDVGEFLEHLHDNLVRTAEQLRREQAARRSR
ncbi:helix-turn-helix domain-containing protein [Actinosynnema sp. NPDC050801]|uniref:GbsR/MarR family transcriptional regulator n=1 Tax=unclassified Actinosynnema TaxID=2637065 RepID=UPI0033F588CB